MVTEHPGQLGQRRLAAPASSQMVSPAEEYRPHPAGAEAEGKILDKTVGDFERGLPASAYF